MVNCNLCDTEYSQGYQGFCSINCYVYQKIDDEMQDFAKRFKKDKFAENIDNIATLITDFITFLIITLDATITQEDKFCQNCGEQLTNSEDE